MKTTKAIVTNNRSWGFFGAIKMTLGLSDGQAGEAYAETAALLVKTHRVSAEVAVLLLDSSLGRHIADTVGSQAQLTADVRTTLTTWKTTIARRCREIQKELAGSPASPRALVEALPAETAQEIRTAYYKAAEGLLALRSALQHVSTETGSPGWRTELLAATEAEKALGRSKLGAHL